MEARRLSDFSVERILSSQPGSEPPDLGAGLATDALIPRTGPASFPGLATFQGPATFPGPAAAHGSSCAGAAVPPWPHLHYFGETWRPSGLLQPASFYRGPSAFVSFNPDPAEVLWWCGYHGYHRYRCDGPRTPPGPHPSKFRMRTTLTSAQSRHLEALFAISDYPTAEARAQVAAAARLGEETVRVWFKNRRARRKRQCSSSKVKPAEATENKAFSAFL